MTISSAQGRQAEHAGRAGRPARQGPVPDRPSGHDRLCPARPGLPIRSTGALLYCCTSENNAGPGFPSAVHQLKQGTMLPDCQATAFSLHVHPRLRGHFGLRGREHSNVRVHLQGLTALVPARRLPLAVIGSGLGGDCVPVGSNYASYYEASGAPAWEVRRVQSPHSSR